MAELTLKELAFKYGYNVGEDGWKNGQDTNIIKSNALLQPHILNDELLAEPATPAVGDAYILPSGVKTGTNWGSDSGAVTNAYALYTNITAGQADNSPWLYLTPAEGWLLYDRASDEWRFFDGANWVAGELVSYQMAASDLTTALSIATNVAYFRAPREFRLIGVRASLLTAGSGVTTVDINKNAVTVLTTKLTIDSSEKTSETAASAAVIDSTQEAVADDDEITIDIDAAGASAAGLIVTLLGAGRR